MSRTQIERILANSNRYSKEVVEQAIRAKAQLDKKTRGRPVKTTPIKAHKGKLAIIVAVGKKKPPVKKKKKNA